MIASDSGADGAQWVLQLCHGYDGPFMDCARQYAALFKDTEYKVCTVYLTGAASEEVRRGSASDDVVFLDYSSRQLRGLKLGAITAVRRLAAARAYQLCIAHRFKPTYVALLATSLPVIGIQHAFDVYRKRSRQLLANLFRERLFLLCVSDAVRDDVRSCLRSWSSRRIETLYNRIDVRAVQADQLERSEARAVLGLREDGWIVGNVGRLHSDKDQATLINGFALALPALPSQSLLVIIGTGKLEADLKRLAICLGIAERVVFLGQVPQARRYFKAFDAFALTSDNEPFGMVLLEAMAADLHLICSDCGGAPEVMGDCGQLFSFGDEAALASCLIEAARISGQELKIYQRDMRRKLDAVFSDQAVRETFWAMRECWGSVHSQVNKNR
ncbi:glycosyltransferase [Pseudomonas sp. OIL-1]|uniref:glycosyltransferase n=1 Tax=Pseudomonas sp. OIL-1 TaxID=2706126 RepID=UPI0013A742FE|nr:glycosyltransferase [Pseudomonas sp. OIL-1]QIB52989.1 glycosyltransferase [Pseudomonas sp. OIL-1]